MCLICHLGRQEVMRNYLKIMTIAREGIVFPLRDKENDTRLFNATVELILALHVSYNVPLQEGTTEDQARKTMTDVLVAEAAKMDNPIPMNDLPKNIQDLMNIFTKMVDEVGKETGKDEDNPFAEMQDVIFEDSTKEH